MKEEAKNCRQCGKTLRGRSDKKFCDDYCRNNYNNQLKAHTNNYVRNINNALGKNRRILQELLSGEKEKMNTTKHRLLQQGFSFKYHTHSHTTMKGDTYYFCYDYGYLPLESDYCLIVRRKEEN